MALLSRLLRYTDLHCHILPGLDDGASTWDEAMDMARNAVKAGAARVVATPHVMRGAYMPRPGDMREKVAELQARLKAAGISLTVVPGAEVFLASGTAREYRAGRLQTIGDSDYILVELPPLSFPKYAWAEIRALLHAGAGVIIAHPERNIEICQDRAILKELIGHGVFFQLNAGSLTGAFGRMARDCAEFLVEENLVHFLGSDAHSGLPAALSAVGADISCALERLMDLSPSGPAVLEQIEARVGRLLSGKL